LQEEVFSKQTMFSRDISYTVVWWRFLKF